jgi:hypothetical protein
MLDDVLSRAPQLCVPACRAACSMVGEATVSASRAPGAGVPVAIANVLIQRLAGQQDARTRGLSSAAADGRIALGQASTARRSAPSYFCSSVAAEIRRRTVTTGILCRVGEGRFER